MKQKGHPPLTRIDFQQNKNKMALGPNVEKLQLNTQRIVAPSLMQFKKEFYHSNPEEYWPKRTYLKGRALGESRSSKMAAPVWTPLRSLTIPQIRSTRQVNTKYDREYSTNTDLQSSPKMQSALNSTENEDLNNSKTLFIDVKNDVPNENVYPSSTCISDGTSESLVIKKQLQKRVNSPPKTRASARYSGLQGRGSKKKINKESLRIKIPEEEDNDEDRSSPKIKYTHNAKPKLREIERLISPEMDIPNLKFNKKTQNSKSMTERLPNRRSQSQNAVPQKKILHQDSLVSGRRTAPPELMKPKDRNKTPGGKNGKYTKPWQEKPKMSESNKKYEKIEIHYEKVLPKGAWYKMTPRQFTFNHKYGLHYESRIKRQKHRQEETEPEFTFENEMQIWLFEKNKNKDAFKGDITPERPRSPVKPVTSIPCTTQSMTADTTLRPLSPTKHPFRSQLGTARSYGTATQGKNQEDLVENDSPIKHQYGKNVRGANAYKDLYERFHANREEQKLREESAPPIQALIKGWLVRSLMRKIKRKVLKECGVTWHRFVNYYKDLLRRIKTRYQCESKSAPFDLHQVLRFLERKAEYESHFYKLSEDDTVARGNLMKFFEKCHFTPTIEELNAVFINIFKVCGNSADIVFLLDCSASVGHINFDLQMNFVKEIVQNLNIGKESVRVGVITYNSEICSVLRLNNKLWEPEEVISYLNSLKYTRGVTRTDLAINKARELFEVARPGVPKTAILVANGSSSATFQTNREAKLAHKEGISILVLGVGNSQEKEELYTIANKPEFVYQVTHYGALKQVTEEIMRKACMENECVCAHNITPDGNVINEAGRGLLKHEALEIIWTFQPPEGAHIAEGSPIPYLTTSD